MKRWNQIQITAYLRPEQKTALDRLSKATRVKQAEYLREGLDMVLARYEKALSGSKK